MLLMIRPVAVLKRLAARTQPWRTPEEMENASEIVPFTLTTLWLDEYRVLMISTRFGGMPIVLRMFQRELRSRESKAGRCKLRIEVGGIHVDVQLGV